MLFLVNVIMGVIYYIELPFFEKHKILPRKWPWKSESKEEVE